MRHLHISLVGGQIEPIYTVVKDLEPNIVVLLYSERTKEDANRLKSIISEYIPTIPHNAIITISLDDKDIMKMKQRILELKEYFNDDYKITINITSGLKPWAILCLQLYGDINNVECIYRNQDNSLWNFKTDKVYSCRHKGLNFEEMQKLQNITVKSYKEFTSFTKEDDIILNEIRELRSFDFKAFNELTKDMYSYPNKTKCEYGNSYLEWDKLSNSFTMHLEKKNGKIKERILISPNIRTLLLNTGWFEYEVASILSRWDKAEEVYTGVHFAINSTDKIKREANETDIIVKTKDKFLFVECKTQIKNSTDIDKFSEVSKAFGGLGSKRIFVTDVEPNENAKDKFRHKKMVFFVMSEINRNHNTINAFYEELDKYMNSINEK